MTQSEQKVNTGEEERQCTNLKIQKDFILQIKRTLNKNVGFGPVRCLESGSLDHSLEKDSWSRGPKEACTQSKWEGGGY